MKYLSYSNYRDSGVSGLGNVPSEWQVAPLKYFVELNPSQAVKIRKSNELCSFVPMENLKMGSLRLDQQRVIDEVLDGYTHFASGDVLQAKVTPCFENMNIAIAADLVNGVGGGVLICL